MDKYLYDLKSIPTAHHDLFDTLNRAIEKAFNKAANNDESLTKANGGYYIVVNAELVEIEQYKDDAPEGLRGWWIAREAKHKWYADPRPTLKALRDSLKG